MSARNKQETRQRQGRQGLKKKKMPLSNSTNEDQKIKQKEHE